MSTSTPLFPTAPTTSDLFVNPRTATTSDSVPTTASNTGGYGWGGGGYGGGQSAYFQTVVISLVALAVLLIISVMFLYYRRRRLRYYRGEEWPFPTLPANGRAGRRRKEEKDFGDVPEMYECLLDVSGDAGGQDVGVRGGSADVWGMGGGQDAVVMGMDDDLAKWQPITVNSLDTRAVPVPITSNQAATDNPPSGAAGRPSTLFSRTLSTSRQMFTLGGVHPVDPPTGDGKPEQGFSTYRTSSGTAQVPLSVTYIIAMPTALRDTQRHPSAAMSPTEGEEQGEEIPEVELGMTNVNLEVPGMSVVTPATNADETRKQKRLKRVEHKANRGIVEDQTGQTMVQNSAIGSDGTLDLVALLNQEQR